jgi:hypothetical protein
VDLFYRGSVLANLLPVEVVTKTGSLSTLSLSQTVPRNTKFLQGPPQDWCLLPQLQVSLIARKNEKESKLSKRKSSKEHGKSLSLVTNAFVDVGEDLISSVCLVLNA